MTSSRMRDANYGVLWITHTFSMAKHLTVSDVMAHSNMTCLPWGWGYHIIIIARMKPIPCLPPWWGYGVWITHDNFRHPFSPTVLSVPCWAGILLLLTMFAVAKKSDISPDTTTTLQMQAGCVYVSVCGFECDDNWISKVHSTKQIYTAH